MTLKEFFQQLEAQIAEYDLLCHPFYKAWTAGELKEADLREYALDYYPHVMAFPTYLRELSIRLDGGELQRAVEAIMREEQGDDDALCQSQRSHAELWLDFAEGMGADRNVSAHEPVVEVGRLISFFHHLAQEATPGEALAAFYAYESQVPRVAAEKARGLREIYGADKRTCAYFTLHAIADVYHADIWRRQLEKYVEAKPGIADKALRAGGAAALSLWRALDGIEVRRLARAA